MQTSTTHRLPSTSKSTAGLRGRRDGQALVASLEVSFLGNNSSPPHRDSTTPHARSHFIWMCRNLLRWNCRCFAWRPIAISCAATLAGTDLTTFMPVVCAPMYWHGGPQLWCAAQARRLSAGYSSFTAMITAPPPTGTEQTVLMTAHRSPPLVGLRLSCGPGAVAKSRQDADPCNHWQSPSPSFASESSSAFSFETH